MLIENIENIFNFFSNDDEQKDHNIPGSWYVH